MKVNLNNTSIYSNNLLKRGFEFAADNGSLFAAGTSLALSSFARPLSILAAPKTDKENKKFACAKSISSSVVGYVLMLCASLPVARGIKRINKNPAKYLKPATIKHLTETDKPLTESKSYQFVTQLFKLGLGFVMAAPKAIMNCMLIPPIVAILNKRNSYKKQKQSINQNSIKNTTQQNSQNITFKGLTNTSNETLAKGIGKIIDKPFIQNISDKLKNSNFAMNIMALTDSLSTGIFIHQTIKSKKMASDRKKTLCYNAAISTGLCITGGYAVDRALEKPTNKFIKKFSEANKNSPKLGKYIEGIKIAKPTLILGGIYYMVIPFISTFLADRIDNADKKQNKSKLKT